ncbi:hypothetical protein Ancab_000351 [Ancistrocladus abbreviatus]
MVNEEERQMDRNRQVAEHGGGGGGVFCCSDFHFLPEGCIADVVSFTSPRDACRLATMSKIFRSAADSDSVWKCFLPSDYQAVIDRSKDRDQAVLNSLPKKQLYYHLADEPILIDGDTKSFWLEKWSGKKCYMIAARSLSIVWGDTPRYWRWTSTSESRFREVAELITVCWLDIRGTMKMPMLSRCTNYAAYLVFKMTEEAYGFYNSAEAAVGTAGGKTETRLVYLDPDEGQRRRYRIVPRRFGLFAFISNRNPIVGLQQAPVPREEDGQYPKQRSDGWLEIEIGEFFTPEDDDGEVQLSVLEIKGGNWKGGLIVQGIEIRPKSNAE